MADDPDKDLDISDKDFIDRAVSVETALILALVVLAALAVVKWWWLPE